MDDLDAELAVQLDRLMAFQDQKAWRPFQHCRDHQSSRLDVPGGPLPIPTPEQLVKAFPGKLECMAKMLLEQLPSVRMIDPDTGRKWAVYAEVRALERAAIAAQHARYTANPDASH